MLGESFDGKHRMGASPLSASLRSFYISQVDSTPVVLPTLPPTACYSTCHDHAPQLAWCDSWPQVTEFCPATASSMGMPWKFHEDCRLSLQKGFLKGFFLAGLQAGRESARQEPADMGLCQVSC